MPGWKEVGARIRAVLKKIVGDIGPGVAETVGANGAKRIKELPQAPPHTRARLAVRFELPPEGGRLQSGLFRHFTALAQGPDVVLADWLDGRAPLGIRATHRARGHLPSLDDAGVGGRVGPVRYEYQFTHPEQCGGN